MSTSTTIAPPGPDLFPDPIKIQMRLGEIIAERRLLRRALRLSLDARRQGQLQSAIAEREVNRAS
jgi:hypothetical protein